MNNNFITPFILKYFNMTKVSQIVIVVGWVVTVAIILGFHAAHLMTSWVFLVTQLLILGLAGWSYVNLIVYPYNGTSKLSPIFNHVYTCLYMAVYWVTAMNIGNCISHLLNI